MIIPINAEKASDKANTHSWQKLRKKGIEANLLNLKKSTYKKKPTVSIILNYERLNVLLLTLEIREGYLLLLLLLTIGLEVLANAERQ